MGTTSLVRSVYTLCQEILKTKVSEVDEYPKALDEITLKNIFGKAKENDELYLMFLLMLNTGYYPVDVRQLEKSMIRKQDNFTYILQRRTKTKEKYIRVNCLWNITAKLLEKQCKKYPNSQYVFLTKAGSPYAESTLGKKYTAFFSDIKHIDNSDVSAKHFRDTVASAIAFKVKNVNVLRVSMGHSIKSTKDEFWKYVESNPNEQKPASDILWKKFKHVL